MTVLIDPKIQERFDRNVAEYRAATAEVGEELKARQQEVAEQVAANKAASAALGKELQEARERGRPRPSASDLEENDISARAEDYQEPDEDPTPVAEPAPRPVRLAAREEDEVPPFHWDEDDPGQRPAAVTPPPPPPPRPRTPRPVREVEEDLSDHDWLE